MGGKKKAAKEKPLDKMTAKELREVAKGIQGINGVHSMSKVELLSDIKEARGIVDDGPKKDTGVIRALKQKIGALKTARSTAIEAKDKDQMTILRRKISKLKKKTRRAA
ncbi:MAG: transcription termination factor Rho [Desulfatibacillum sp.]|nr:transcription termination factor Rho [Desulfatibacillum sp.]